jgi:hypothetical protein
VHTITDEPATEVVERQYVPGNDWQSESVVQPGTHVSLPLAPWMQALGRPSELPPAAPSPTQSDVSEQASVHQRPVHESPALHVDPAL